jgi:bifunctional DNase/RNase
MIRVALSKIIFYPPAKDCAVAEGNRGERQVPIIVGIFEAQSIALAIEEVKMPRPMTHDLFVSVLQEFGARIDSVVVSDLVEGTFYAKIEIRLKNDQILYVDARPSDAIALALRMKATILVAEDVMQEAGSIWQANIASRRKKTRAFLKSKTSTACSTSKSTSGSHRRGKLRMAAQLRDQINSLQRELNIN